tara:strand:+ start:2654 stop:2854 length:201 start_codon:yes stop_codon:yes gene_type:complete
MVLNLFLDYNIYNKMAKNKNHDKVVREYEKKKSDHLEKIATKMLKHDKQIQKLRDKKINLNLLNLF